MIRSVGIIVLVLTLAFEPLVTAGPLWIKETAKANGAKNVLKKIGSRLMQRSVLLDHGDIHTCITIITM